MARSSSTRRCGARSAAGARLDRIALLDNFCWPDPIESDANPDGAYKLGQLVRACRGLYDACRAYGTPLVSGKDSMKNDSTMGGVRDQRPADAARLGPRPDRRRASRRHARARRRRATPCTSLGTTRDETRRQRVLPLARRAGRRACAPRRAAALRRATRAAPSIRGRRCRSTARWPRRTARGSCARPRRRRSAGSRSPARASVVASELGLDLDLERRADLAGLAPDAALFSESNGRFVVTVRPTDAARLEAAFAGLACRRLGLVTAAPRLVVRRGPRALVDLDVPALRARVQGAFADA